jgi:transcriptional regulator with XRE-family HTH domain
MTKRLSELADRLGGAADPLQGIREGAVRDPRDPCQVGSHPAPCPGVLENQVSVEPNNRPTCLAHWQTDSGISFRIAQELFSTFCDSAEVVTYPVTDVPKTGSGKTKQRPVKVPAFGAALKKARGTQSLPLVKMKTGVSTSYVYQLEQGTTEAPDPVKLMKLAEYYGLDFVKLVNLLRWNRENLGAKVAPSVVPEGEGMRVSGAEAMLMTRIRKFGVNEANLLEEYMELLERRAGGGAAAKKATF